VFWYHPIYIFLNCLRVRNLHIQNQHDKQFLIDIIQSYARAHPEYVTNNRFQNDLVFEYKHHNNSYF